MTPNRKNLRPKNLHAVFGFGRILVARGIAATGGIALSLVVARIGGTELLGQFSYALSVVVVLALLGKLGLDFCLMRTAARWLVEDRGPLLAPGLRLTLGRAGLASLVLMTLLGGGLALGIVPRQSVMLATLAPAVLVLAMLGLMSGYLKGRKRASEAVMIDIGGLSLATALVLWALNLAGVTLVPWAIAAVFLAIGVGLAGVMGVRCLADARRLGANAGPPVPLSDTEQADLSSGWRHFTLIAVAGFLTQAGAFAVIGPFMDDAQLGLARAAERLAVLIGLPLTVIGPYLAPRLVEAHSRGARPALRRLVRLGCGLSIAMALPTSVICVVFAEPLLALFGQGFSGAVPALRILVIGQLATALAGPFQMYLNMTGHEHLTSRILIAALVLCLVLFPLGAITAGPAGFAAAAALIACLKAGALIYIGLWGPARLLDPRASV